MDICPNLGESVKIQYDKTEKPRGDTEIVSVARDVISSSAHACQSPATFFLLHLRKYHVPT